MELKVLDNQGNEGEAVTVSAKNFDAVFKEALVHQVAVACRAYSRSGTAAQKNRSAVRGGGAKPVRQKGTGRARVGTLSSPLRRGGGRTFAAIPRDYSKKVNRKTFRAAMRSILSEIVRRGNLVVVNDMVLENPKTKELASRLRIYNCQGALIVDIDVGENLDLASRNLPNVHVLTPSMLNPSLMQDHENILMTKSAVMNLDEWLA